MFSGIVEAIGTVLKIDEARAQRRVWIRTPRGWRLRSGESVCVEGVCSTVQARNARAFQVIYMSETLRRSTLQGLTVNSAVNLERSLTLQGLIGGHLVQGHVDGAARITRVKEDGSARIYTFKLPGRLMRYIAEKGSVAIDGVSLTVIKPGAGQFSVSLLDYTLVHTTLGGKGPNDRVNVEVDVLAKYVEKLLAR